MHRDALSDMLRAARLHTGAFFYQLIPDIAWHHQAPPCHEMAAAVAPGSTHCISFHLLVKGNCFARLRGEEPVPLQVGDLVIVAKGDVYQLGNDVNALPKPVEISELRRKARELPPAPESGSADDAVRAAQQAIDAAGTVFVCGFLVCDRDTMASMLSALPPMLVWPGSQASSWSQQIIRQAAYETAHRTAGSDAMVEQLAQMVFVDTVRRYLEQLPADATGWLAAVRDRFVGRALSLIHERPHENWTLDSLGAAVGLARSALHERFVMYLGLAPIQYLTAWRLQTGAGLLQNTQYPVSAIAQQVGYESEAAFSRAFKRQFEMPPGAWRRARMPQLET
ncbi:MAG TPA: AraC family transcriptional regulator [Burkholderiaceae bacterium]